MLKVKSCGSSYRQAPDIVYFWLWLLTGDGIVEFRYFVIFCMARLVDTSLIEGFSFSFKLNCSEISFRDRIALNYQ